MTNTEAEAEIQQLTQTLATTLKTRLRVVAGSVIHNVDATSATLRSYALNNAGAGSFDLEFLVKLLIEHQVDDSKAIWGLLFLYMGGERLAPSSSCFLRLTFEVGKWQTRGWEDDLYGEWEDLKTLG